MSFNNIITIDIGNTKTSFCLKTKDQLSYFNKEDLNSNIDKYHLNSSNTKIIVSSVKNSFKLNSFKQIDLKNFYTQNSFFSMPVNYNETIGIDRLVCSYWAYANKMKSIIIDSGTFTTIDLVDSNGLNGGYILVGLEHLKNAYSHGENLKSFNPKLSKDLSLATTSQDAINKGLTLSFISSIKEVINKHPNFQIILTGGNSYKLKELLSDLNLKIDLKKNLIHESMHLISEVLI